VSHTSEQKQPRKCDGGVYSQTMSRPRVVLRRQSFVRARFESAPRKARLNGRPCQNALSAHASRRTRAAGGRDVRVTARCTSSRTRRIYRGRSLRNERTKVPCNHRWRARRSCRLTTTARWRRRRDSPCVRFTDTTSLCSRLCYRRARRRTRADLCERAFHASLWDVAWGAVTARLSQLSCVCSTKFLLSLG